MPPKAQNTVLLYDQDLGGSPDILPMKSWLCFQYHAILHLDLLM